MTPMDALVPSFRNRRTNRHRHGFGSQRRTCSRVEPAPPAQRRRAPPRRAGRGRVCRWCCGRVPPEPPNRLSCRPGATAPWPRGAHRLVVTEPPDYAWVNGSVFGADGVIDIAHSTNRSGYRVPHPVAAQSSPTTLNHRRPDGAPNRPLTVVVPWRFTRLFRGFSCRRIGLGLIRFSSYAMLRRWVGQWCPAQYRRGAVGFSRRGIARRAFNRRRGGSARPVGTPATTLPTINRAPAPPGDAGHDRARSYGPLCGVALLSEP